MNKREKWLLFLLVFAGTIGILKVDEAYGDMMDRDGILCVSLRRVDEENIRISAFGREEEINEERVAAAWEDVQETVTAALDAASSRARTLLGLSEGEDGEDEPLQRVVFPVQTL